ncbi:MAG: DUF3105 domain-containing protein [Actinomycetota bacterium]|nr:DUF3105 domain-containing protein [Actinomycetota bacterium]
MGSGRQRGRIHRASENRGGGKKLYLIIGGVAAVFLIGFGALVYFDSQQGPGGAPAGVATFDNLARQHVEGSVDYAETPPVGGEHDAAWQNCGFYEEPVRNENAVHSLEHGAIWITYSPDLGEGEVDEIREIANGQTYILASPYEDLPSPVVASAWGNQLELESAADSEELDQFIRAFRQGPQTPEPGAACTGGVGSPS